jgi:heme exporter protein C
MGGPTIDSSMLWPLLVMAVGYLLLFKTLLFVRMRTALNERKARALQLAAPQRRRAAPAALPDGTAVLR